MRKHQREQPKTKDATLEGAAEPVPLPPAPEPEEHRSAEDVTPVELPRSKKVAASTRWRVAREAMVNVNGAITRLVEGQVLDPLGYSEQTIISIRAQGVVLEPVE